MRRGPAPSYGASDTCPLVPPRPGDTIAGAAAPTRSGRQGGRRPERPLRLLGDGPALHAVTWRRSLIVVFFHPLLCGQYVRDEVHDGVTAGQAFATRCQ